MLVASSSGTITEGYTFNSSLECERAVNRLKVNAVCIEKKPVDIELQMHKMISLMKQMQNEMNKE
jgi:hypothetical protein